MAKLKRPWNFDLADWDSPRLPEGWVQLSDINRGVGVQVKVIEIDGLPEIVGLHVESFMDEALGSHDIRSLPLNRLKSGAVAALSGSEDVLEAAEAAKGGPIHQPDEHYREVAAIYKANLAHAPLKAVQEAFGVSRAGASKKVARAREEGFLGWPMKPGRAGTAAKKSPYAKPKSRVKKGKSS